MNWNAIMKRFTLLGKSTIRVGHYVENLQFDDLRGGIVQTIGISPYYSEHPIQSAYIIGWCQDKNGNLNGDLWGDWYPIIQLQSYGSAKKLFRKGLIPSATVEFEGA